MKKLALLVCLALAAGAAQAQEIYKHVLPDGKVVYSDKPPAEGAERVELSPLQTFHAPPARPLGSSDDQDDKNKEVAYGEFAISRPGNNETIRDNGGTINISLSLRPGLQGGHSIDIVMDGKTLGSGRATSITLTNVDRGSHRVQATIKDEDGKVVERTSSVTFHLKRRAAGG